VQLKGFLSLLKAAASGKQDGVLLAPLIPASTKQIANLKTKIVITNRSDYPVTAGFPLGLETLVVTGCALKRIETRILRLSRLVTLDLSNNSLSALPDDWSAMNCLAELKLSKNRLLNIPHTIFSGRRLTTLAHLDLSENQLAVLPSSLVDLSNLAVLKVDANQLVSLPQGFGRLRRLVHFSAAGNQLQALPADFDRLTLQNLDLFENPLSEGGPSSLEIVDGAVFPTLFELAARCVKNYR
jgi:Leucine-rich repeat (LRR) protein